MKRLISCLLLLVLAAALGLLIWMRLSARPAEQSENAPAPIKVTPCGITAVLSEEHPENASD